MSETLESRIAAGLDRPVDPAVRAFAARLAVSTPDAAGVLFYGSNLRTGSLEGVLDFYVLTHGPQRERIWPRVSYHEWEIEGVPLRAKVATMALETFRSAAAGERLDTTIWARFVQPGALSWQRDEAAARQVVAAACAAATTAARLAVALGPDEGLPGVYWRALFRATYAAEFRVEKAGREDSILAVNRDHFDGLLPLALNAAGIAFEATPAGAIRPGMARRERARLLGWWRRRQRLGKPYNIVRLFKAAATFDGAARYAAWKIERHTGVAVPLTPWQERHPHMAAPGVLWRVWRARRRQAAQARPDHAA